MRPEAATRPSHDVFLITLDTTRADHLGVHGRLPWRTLSPSPNLDRLADGRRRLPSGLRLRPRLRLPSHVTMLTGLEPPQHGVRENNDFRLADAATRRTFAHDRGTARAIAGV